MTCIATIAHHGKVTMGCDSAATYPNFNIITIASSKMFSMGEIQVGVCGSGRVQDIMNYQLKLPSLPRKLVDLRRWLVVEFIPRTRLAFREGGLTHVKNEVETFEGAMLLAIRGRVFLLECDFQIEEDTLPFAAIGSGGLIASGSLYSTQETGLSPKQRVTLALEAAERYNAAVRRPFNVVTV